jgi:hypothetical protein
MKGGREMISRIEQFRSRLIKLEGQVLQEEVNEIIGSTVKLVSVDGSSVDNDPVVTCPACGEEAGFIEAQLDSSGKRWVYYDGYCQNCDTEFVIGEVPHKCALCDEPLPCDPHEDVNELYHHWCEKDRQHYCTPCFMQLFFDGYIDLSSENPNVRDDEPCPGCVLPYSIWYTHVGRSVAPYCSRLVGKGYEEVAAVKEWDEIKQVCRQIVSQSRRYLILSISGDEPERRYYYVIYQTRLGCNETENQQGCTQEIKKNL